jgi:mannose-6-phosphate isomerase-like protein (cupin superfamily)
MENKGMTKINRVVVGVNADRQSAVVHRDTDNIQTVPGVFWRSTLWGVDELPVDNGIAGDRGSTNVARTPDGNGVIFRAVEIPPNPADRQQHIQTLHALHKTVKQKYPPTEADMARHPSMHRTDTLDMFVITRGEIYLVTDTDETLLKAGDTAVVQGVNHAWDNRSDQPCMILGVMVSALPWAPGAYR